MLNRCTHCASPYTYQMISWGAPPFNDSQYCPDCAERIHTALKSVPRRFECRFRPISEIPAVADVTLEMVLEWERQWDYETQGVAIRRIYTGLVDVETGDTQDVRLIKGKSPYTGWGFKVATWKQSPEYSIEIPMEFDLQVGQFTGEQWF